MKENANFSMVSLGCARSLVDSESMVDGLQKLGFTLVPEGSNESVTVLNTCSFIQSAIDETERNISELIKTKHEGKIKHLVVAGCYPSRFKKAELLEKYPEVDLWFTTKEETQLPTALAKMVFQKRFHPPKTSYTKLTPTHYAYLKISEGCNNWCAFCTIPKIRGEHVSKPLDEILKEASFQISLGAKELILIAEDTTCWGEDIYGKPSLPILLEALAKLPADWIRLMYIFPPRVDDALVKVISENDTIIPYLDIPIQHVNSTILEKMRRRHDRPFLESVLDKFKQSIPNLALRTTFILGFPGETDADVEEICEFLETHRFDQVGCFTYSQERETRSFKYDDQVPTEIARQRVDKVMQTQYGILHSLNESRIGSTMTVLYEGNRKARAYHQAPDVDTMIILDSDESLIQGTFYEAKITGQDGYDLLAQVLR